MQSLYQQIALVPQEMHLFGGTIRDNIRYGRVSASDEEIVAAARAANAHKFIIAFPEVYETLSAKKGSNFSAGKGKRIATRRQWLKDPGFPIWNKATRCLTIDRR